MEFVPSDLGKPNGLGSTKVRRNVLFLTGESQEKSAVTIHTILLVILVVHQFEITPKAFANFSPRLEAQRQPWD